MTCKGKGYRFLFILTFVMISLLLTPQAFANDGEDNTSADLISLVKEFESEGQFSNGSAVRALTMHLTAVSLFEKQEATNKVVEHMNSFKILLNHQLDHQLITENAFNELTENTNAMIDKWNSITIVEDGQAQAVVLVAEDAHEEINRAAGILIDYVEKSTGAQLPIQTTEQWLNEGDGETIAIYIGESVSGEEAALVEALEDLNDQGFVILPTETTVTIAGPTVWGTLNGVYDFLERYLDIRWLMVGPDGEDVPPLTDVLIPLEDIIEEPAFSYRLISPTRGNPAETEGLVQAQNEWAQRNKLQGGYNRPVENQENIYSLFPVEKYGETNPEFYPAVIRQHQAERFSGSHVIPNRVRLMQQ